MVSHNLLLTGIPRSGTTLTCSLLNRLPQVLALIEPMDMRALTAAGSEAERIRYITGYLAAIRQDALERGVAPAKLLVGDGTNTFATNTDGKRASSIQGDATVPHGKDLKEDFTLVVKHPNAFAALLPELVAHFRCVALVRNPLAVLASWNSLDHPLSRGHAPMAEAFDSNLAGRLRQEDDHLSRQLLLLDWYFSQFISRLPANQVLRYEDIIATSGRALSVIAEAADTLPAAADLRLQNQNVNHLYHDLEAIEKAADLLLADESNGCWQLYDQVAVHALKTALLE